MPSLLQTLNLKLAAWLRAAAARMEPRAGGTNTPMAEAAPAAFGPPAHWAERVRGSAPQLLESETASPVAMPPARSLSNPLPSSELPPPPPMVRASPREEQRHQPGPRSSQNKSAEQIASNRTAPTSHEEEGIPKYPVITPAPIARQPLYPIQPERGKISRELATAATSPAPRDVRLRSSSSPDENRTSHDARKRSPALRLSPAPRIASASPSRPLPPVVEMVSSAPHAEPTPTHQRATAVPRVSPDPSPARRNPARADRMDATPMPVSISTQPSAPATEFRPVLPERRVAAPAVYPSLASASAISPARFPSILPPRSSEAPALPTPALAVVQGERWPTLPVRESADLREEWLAWQRDARHQARLDEEQQGLPWTA